MTVNNPFTPQGPFSSKDGFIYNDSPDFPFQYNTPIDGGTLFNERGFGSSNNSSIDGEEVINEFNGALSYKIPLYDFKGPGDLKATVDLIYASNVDHTIISSEPGYATWTDPYIQYNFGFPEWIISLNGIGVQVMNFQDHFFTQKNGSDYTTGENVRCLVNGYHLTHEMKKFPDSASEVDRIYILKGDGSVDTLVNIATSYTGNPRSYTSGNYASVEGTGFSRAIVEFIDSPSPNFPQYDLRRMYYMKGDGLTYIFEEIYNNYLDYPSISGSSDKKTKVFILTEIKDRFGNNLVIEHMFNWPLITPNPEIPGRPLLNLINCDWDKCSSIGFDWRFLVLGDTHRVHVENEIQGDCEIIFPDFTGWFEGATRYGRTSVVKNQINQETTIQYETYVRKMQRMYYGNRTVNDEGVSKVNMNGLKRINYIVNFNGAQLSYYYTQFAVEEMLMDLDQVFKTIQSQNDLNYRGQGRDLFFVNMLSEVNHNINESIIKQIKYDYQYIPNRTIPLGGDNGDRYNTPIHFEDKYVTQKIITTQQNSTLNATPLKIKELKYYKAYATMGYQFNIVNKDFGSKILLSREENSSWIPEINDFSSIPYYKKEYYYETGIYIRLSGHPGVVFPRGSFLLSGIVETFDGIANRESEFTYVFFTNSESSWFKGEEYKNPVKQIIQKIQKINDQWSGMIVQSFDILFTQNNLPYLHGKYDPSGGPVQSYDANDKYVYLLALKTFEANVDNNFRGKIETWEYEKNLTSTTYFGTLKNYSLIDEKNANNKLSTNYFYAKSYILGRELYTPSNIMPSIEGNLIKRISPKGNINNFYYHPIQEEEVVNPGDPVPQIEGILMFDDNTFVSVPQEFQDRRFYTRLDYIPKGESDYSVKNYFLRIYNGELSVHISSNQFLSSFNYDPITRLLDFAKPYDYSYTPGESYTSKNIYDDSENKVTTISKISNGDVKKIENFYDSFQRLISTKLYTDVSTYDELQFFYNYLDQKSKFIDAKGYETKYSYDASKNLKRTEYEDGSSSLVETTYQGSLDNYNGYLNYKMCIKKVKFVDEEGCVTEKYFDIRGNILREKMFIPNTRDSKSWTDVFVPFKTLQTDYIYEAINRLIKVVTPTGKIINYSYDGFGRLIQTTTPDSGSTKYLYDNDSNIVYSQNSEQAISATNPYTFYSYDNANRLIGVGLAGSNTESYPEFDYLNPDEYYYFRDVNNSDAPISNLDDYIIFNIYDYLENAPSGFLTVPTDYNSDSNFTIGNIACIAFRSRVSDNWSFKYYRYDARGRVIKEWIIIDGLGEKSIDYNYTSLDGILKISNSSSHNEKLFRMSYDKLGRFLKTEVEDTSSVPSTFFNLAEYSYNENSQISQCGMNDNKQILEYDYDNRNRIIRIGDENEFFDYNLEYYKNGNVKIQICDGNYNDVFPVTDRIGQNFIYDTANRLLKSEKISPSNLDVNIYNTYDSDGNFLKMVRNYNGDDFVYTYAQGTNKLIKVSGAENQFLYDLKGNITDDKLLKNSNMLFDYQNLLLEVKHEYGNYDPARYQYTRYWYDENGNRIKKLVLNSIAANPSYPDWNDPTLSGDWEVFQEIYYLRTYSGKILTQYNGSELDYHNIIGNDMIGKINEDGTLRYYYKDHLGSIRCVLNETNDLISATDYDSWGMIVRDWQSTTNLKYSSKEYDFENDYEYFGARNYSSRIGRWLQIDPLFKEHYDFTPYNYVLNNPITLIDPDGRQTNPASEFQQGLNAVNSKLYNTIVDFSKKVGYTSKLIITAPVIGGLIRKISVGQIIKRNIPFVAIYEITPLTRFAFVAGFLFIAFLETPHKGEQETLDRYKKEQEEIEKNNSGQGNGQGGRNESNGAARAEKPVPASKWDKQNPLERYDASNGSLN
jgi:RHS repeat-associated protein